MTRLSFCVFSLRAFLLLFFLEHGGCATSGAVNELDPRTFHTVVGNSPFIWVVEFRRRAPSGRLYQQAEVFVDHLKGIAKIGSVSCDTPEAMQLANRFHVASFPSLRLFAPNVPPATSAMLPLTKKEIIDFLLRTIPNHSMNVTDSPSFIKFMNMGFVNQIRSNDQSKGRPDGLAVIRPPRALIFTDKKRPTVMTRTLASFFKGRMLIGVVLGYQDLIKRYYVDTIPSILLLPDENVPFNIDEAPRLAVASLQGGQRYPVIVSFLNQYALPASATSAPKACYAPPPAWMDGMTADDFDTLSAAFAGPTVTEDADVESNRKQEEPMESDEDLEVAEGGEGEKPKPSSSSSATLASSAPSKGSVAAAAPPTASSEQIQLAKETLGKSTTLGLHQIGLDERGFPFREVQGVRFTARALTDDEVLHYNDVMRNER